MSEAEQEVMGGLTFTDALDYLELGHSVTRREWDGERTIAMIPESGEQAKAIHVHWINKAEKTMTVDLWRPEQVDILADDWCLVIEEA